MRDEDEIQKMADDAAHILTGDESQRVNETTIEYGGEIYDIEHLRGIRDALDWVLDEDMEDDPL